VAFSGRRDPRGRVRGRSPAFLTIERRAAGLLGPGSRFDQSDAEHRTPDIGGRAVRTTAAE
jgi:hypothetical protein